MLPNYFKDLFATLSKDFQWSEHEREAVKILLERAHDSGATDTGGALKTFTEDQLGTVLAAPPSLSVPPELGDSLAPSLQPEPKPERSDLDSFVEIMDVDPSRDHLGDYTDMGLLGKGGMGEVRLVRDPVLNRTMALKILSLDVHKDKSISARFIEEAQITAQLQHPGIASVHELGHLPDGRYYYTMEEIRGETLAEKVFEVHAASPGKDHWGTAQSGWTFRRLMTTFLQVCEAMAYAHRRGVVHRDLKPSNIMVGEYGACRVVDWGLAKVLRHGQASQQVSRLEAVHTERTGHQAHATRVGTVMGTPGFMAPEQALGEIHEIDPRADVYSLGCVLYNILSGQFPIEESSLGVLFQRMRSGDIDPLPKHARIPEELAALCTRALATNKDDRFDTAADLAAEVTAWLDGARRHDQAQQALAKVGDLLAQLRQAQKRARILHGEAERLLDEVESYDPVDRKRPAWDKQQEAEETQRHADLIELAYLMAVTSGLNHVPDLPEAHESLASYYQMKHAEAEAARHSRLTKKMEILLRVHDRRGQYTSYLTGHGALTLSTDPPGADAILYRYVTQDRRLVPELVRDLGRTPLIATSLPMGSYLIVLRKAGYAEVRYPVRIERQRHWSCTPPGHDVPLPVFLPVQGQVSPNEVYVPAGWCTLGGDRMAYQSIPRKRLWLDGFLIQRFPVTNREYLIYLNEQVRRGGRSLGASRLPRGRLGDRLFTWDDKRGVYRLSQDLESLADCPVISMDYQCVYAYARYWGEATGQPWRLPGELEWEKAARGVDERTFPWGSYRDPTWCCSQDGQQGEPRIAPVHSYPIDTSPYGVRGLGGNSRDWCSEEFRMWPAVSSGAHVSYGLTEEPLGPEGTYRVMRGGSWYLSGSCRAAARLSLPGSLRIDVAGIRLVCSIGPSAASCYAP